LKEIGIEPGSVCRRGIVIRLEIPRMAGPRGDVGGSETQRESKEDNTKEDYGERLRACG